MDKLNQKARQYLRNQGFSEDQIESGEWKKLINQPDDLAEVEDAPAIEYPTGPAIVADMPNEVYHAGKGTSKSTLWAFGKSKSPAHFRHNRDNPKPKTAAQINQFAMGSAIHTVIMEPHLFGETVVRGPSDRRGKKWKDLQEAYPDANILLDKDYDGMDKLRDKIHTDDFLSPILGHAENMIEHSAFWTDQETGMLCKCRPDLVHPPKGLIVDIKTTTDATPWEFAKIMGDLGYHAQEDWYTEGWVNAGGQAINGFVFLVVERDPPFEFRVFELPPEAAMEGREAIRDAKLRYHKCLTENHWPGYERIVEEIDLKPWHYKHVQREAA